MTSQAIFNSILVLHLTGFVLFTGTTVVDVVTLSQFWKQYARNGREAARVLEAMVKFPVLQRIGIALLVLSGIGMMAMTRGVFGEQTWFRVKFAIVLLLVLNILLVGRRLVAQLHKMVQAAIAPPEKTGKIKASLRLFHIVQLAFLFTILLLSVFKFN